MGVDLFFVVSGFIMAVTTQRRASGAQPASAFLLRRVTRIYPCYLLVTGAVLAVFLWRPDLVNSSEDVRPDVLASFLLLPQEGLPLLLVGWTLVYEMLFYAVLAATLLVRRSWLWWVLGVWVALIVGLAPLEQATSNVWVGLVLSPRNLSSCWASGWPRSCWPGAWSPPACSASAGSRCWPSRRCSRRTATRRRAGCAWPRSGCR
jgi:peptidoglycan/LPS O-acetylase OafA/YrhL